MVALDNLEVRHEFLVQSLFQELVVDLVEIPEQLCSECTHGHGAVVDKVTYLDECVVK